MTSNVPWENKFEVMCTHEAEQSMQFWLVT